jgi:hypothetical protein
LVHISWINFKDIRVNWNEELSLLSTCEGCGETPGLSYSWELFLVNATEKHRIEGENDGLLYFAEGGKSSELFQHC